MDAARRTPALLLAAVLGLAACSDDVATVGGASPDDVGEVTLQSGDSTASAEPICVGDVPADPATCAGAPGDRGQVELDPTRKATLVVPRDVAVAGYEVRLDGRTLVERGDEERNVVLDVPVVAGGGSDLVLTVEGLRGPSTPAALWQFVLAPPGPA